MTITFFATWLPPKGTINSHAADLWLLFWDQPEKILCFSRPWPDQVQPTQDHLSTLKSSDLEPYLHLHNLLPYNGNNHWVHIFIIFTDSAHMQAITQKWKLWGSPRILPNTGILTILIDVTILSPTGDMLKNFPTPAMMSMPSFPQHHLKNVIKLLDFCQLDRWKMES